MKTHGYAALIPLAAVLAAAPALAQNQSTPDALVRAAVENVVTTIQSDPGTRSGDMAKITALLNKLATSSNKEVKQFAIERSRAIAQMLQQQQQALAAAAQK